MYNPTIMEAIITIKVIFVDCCLVGQVTFLSSVLTSERYFIVFMSKYYSLDVACGVVALQS